ncbi:expansin EXLX1 family cellulose-binding protein [Xanthomonas maliensis]|uniref:expansin EXLX1 family cellulose-binding protein n=1 Tax=Xanthomonas maliensis TaxID=1321368 RepID=UPI00039AD06F|nr:expansin EXLX1 family cellulose-binding protein [Xanthomonas maliensis]KAB7772567.1 cellulase [Xanthomonas maliensis]
MRGPLRLLLAATLLAPSLALALQVDTQGRLVDGNGQAQQLRGVTWPGFDRPTHVASGLEYTSLESLLDTLQQAQVNAVRLPICAATLQGAAVDASAVQGDAHLSGLNATQVLDAVIAASTRHGMQVLLAYAQADCDDAPPRLGADVDGWMTGLAQLARRYGNRSGVIGVDLGSSGYGNAHWAAGPVDTDWSRIAARAAAVVAAQAPHWLVGVEGVGDNAVCSDGAHHTAGSNLQPLACTAARIPARQLLLLPKLSGPDRAATDSLANGDIAGGSPTRWQRDFGQMARGHAVVPVSLGGGLGDGDPRDVAWQQDLSAYLAGSGLRSAFLGSWEVATANNGGLLAADGRLRADKLQILQRAWGVAKAPPATATATPTSAGGTGKASGWSSTFSGTATYTSSGYSGGALLLDPIPSTAFITALNPVQLNYGGVKAALAGAYLQVTGPKGTTTVYVTDLYPNAASGGLDLSPNAFAAIGDTVQGRIPVSWTIVRGPVSGNVQYRIKEGSSRYWAAIQVRNHAYPVMKMEVKQGSRWKNLQKMDYNHFLGEQLGNQPLTLRLTDIRGKVVTDTLPRLPEDGSQPAYFEPGHVQFP